MNEFLFSFWKEACQISTKAQQRVLLHAARYAYKTATSTGWGSFSKALDLGKFTEINQNADQTSRVKAYNHQLVSEYNIWQNQARVAFELLCKIVKKIISTYYLNPIIYLTRFIPVWWHIIITEWKIAEDKVYSAWIIILLLDIRVCVSVWLMITDENISIYMYVCMYIYTNKIFNFWAGTKIQ